MTYYQQLLQNHSEIKKAMVETKGTPDHQIWVNMHRWSIEEIKRHLLIGQQSA